MCNLHKKALQPAHPSEPIVGQFFNNPPCQRCVPIYPLRYAITNIPYDHTAQPQLDTADYPVLKGSKHYGLRVLRPDSYVYLFYFKDGRMWTQHYLVTEDARFAALWWNEKDHDDPTPGRHARPDLFGATAYIPAPETRMADTVWLLVSNTLLSHCTLWKIEQDTDHLRSRLATVIQPAGGAGQAHSLPSVQLKELVPELVLQPALSALQGAYRFQVQSLMDTESHPMHWSESQPLPLTGVRIDSDMRKALMARTDIQPLALVLQDPFGITSELNHLATAAVQAKTKFAADHAHKLSSAQLITGYFQQAHSPALNETLRRQKELVRWVEAQRFPAAYAQQIAAFEAPIRQAVEDVIAWVKLAQPGQPLGLALACFDLKVIRNAQDYEEAVFQCIGALVHSETGRQRLGSLVDAPVERSLYWLAVAQGNLDLLATLKNSLVVSKGVFDVVNHYLEEHAATPTTNALIGLLQAVPNANQADILVRRLRHVLEMRFNATLIQHDLSAGQYLRFARELQGYQTLGPELIKRWDLSIDTTVTPDTVGVRMKFYEWVKVGETDYRVIDSVPTQRPALPPKRAMPLEGNPLLRSVEKLRGPAGHLFTGVGGVVAVLGMVQTKAAWNQERNSATFLSLVGAGSALIGAGIEIAASGIAVTATTRGNLALATSAKVYAAKRGVAVFGAGAAGLFAISDGLKAVNAANEHNPEQARLYLGAALAGGVVTLSTWAGGTATASALMGTGGIVLGLNPLGWALFAVAAVISGVTLALWADEAEHGPVDTWLKHSAWGVHPKHYTQQQELEVFYHLLYRPRLSAQWDQSLGSDVGALSIDCFLPGSSPDEQLSWVMQATLEGQKLEAIEGPILYASGTRPIDYQRQYIVTRGASLGAQRNWTITLHKDAHVAVEYLYQPNPQEQPDTALTQPGAPAPLIFTAGGWFSSPIDEQKLALVEPPK